MTNKVPAAMARISGRTAAEKVRLSTCGRPRRLAGDRPQAGGGIGRREAKAHDEYSDRPLAHVRSGRRAAQFYPRRQGPGHDPAGDQRADQAPAIAARHRSVRQERARRRAHADGPACHRVPPAACCRSTITSCRSPAPMRRRNSCASACARIAWAKSSPRCWRRPARAGRTCASRCRAPASGACCNISSRTSSISSWRWFPTSRRVRRAIIGPKSSPGCAARPRRSISQPRSR